MNAIQLQHIDNLRSNARPSCAAKDHRICYTMPTWMRDGFKSEAHADLDRWGETACRYYASDDGNPRAERAARALKLVKNHSFKT